MPRIRVLIIDASVIIRRHLAESLARDEDLEVVGTASSGRLGLAKIVQLSPDVVLLDADLPEMDGLTVLREIRGPHPRLPVVLMSATTDDDATRRRAALASGASEHVVKQHATSGSAAQVERLHDDLVPKIRTLCADVSTPAPPGRPQWGAAPAPRIPPPPAPSRTISSRVPQLIARHLGPSAALRALSARRLPTNAGDAPAHRIDPPVRATTTLLAPRPLQHRDRPTVPHCAELRDAPRVGAPTALGVLAIASSTGGPAALAAVLAELPASFPLPVVIAQHMPPMFTRLLAERLSLRCPLAVHEAQGGEILHPGAAWIAPGDHHMVLEQGPAGLELRLNQEPPENSCRPSADVLFRSVAIACGVHAIALVLTGMGQDGLNGCRWIKERRGRVLAQDEQTSVVWGMPGYVARAGIADRVVPLQHVASELLRMTDADAVARLAHVVGAKP